MSLTVQDVLNAKRREDLVPGYAEWIRDIRGGPIPHGIADVNHAIIDRWSDAALLWIKKRAWRESGFR